jgi:hypothetical protein
MSFARRAGVLLVVIALALTLGAGLAGAGKHKKHKGKKWASKITLVHPSPTQFTGTVSSKLKPCRAQRVVTVYYTDPLTAQTLPLSVQRTNKKGHYQVDLPKPAFVGSYHAQVAKRKIRALKRKQTCKSAQSGFIAVAESG